MTNSLTSDVAKVFSNTDIFCCKAIHIISAKNAFAIFQDRNLMSKQSFLGEILYLSFILEQIGLSKEFRPRSEGTEYSVYR